MAEILGHFVTRRVELIHAVNPDAEVYAWSDMLDPNHNAHANYYLVDGDYTGSWEHVPRDLNIVAWYYAMRRPSLAHSQDSNSVRSQAPATRRTTSTMCAAGWTPCAAPTARPGSCIQPVEDKYGLLADFGDLVSRAPEA
jgi:hypothetical protein